MTFSKLSQMQKEQLHHQITSFATSIGGDAIFFQLLEDIRSSGIELLADKSTKFRFNGGNISWNKYIYKDTFALFIEALDEKKDMFSGLKAKKQKTMLNMLKTLKPVVIKIKPKNMKDGEGFIVSIIETDDKNNANISLIFKIIFLYNIKFSKKLLAYM